MSPVGDLIGVVFCLLVGLLFGLLGLTGGVRYPTLAGWLGAVLIGIGLLRGYPVVRAILEIQGQWNVYSGRATLNIPRKPARLAEPVAEDEKAA